MSVLIKNDAFVTIHYLLSDLEGQLIHSSRPDAPLTYQQGHHQIVPGLEAALEGHRVGDRLSVSLEPEAAYGPVDPEKQFWVDRSAFPPGRLEIGQTLELTPEDGPAYMGTIISVNKHEVEVDANHPLAGEDLQFEVEVMAISCTDPR